MWDVLGVLVTVIGVMAVAIKLLMDAWFKSQHALEEERKTNNNRTQNRLDEELKQVRSLVTEITGIVRGLISKMDVADKRINELQQSLARTDKLVQEFATTGSELVRNMIKTEVTNISHQLMMIKNKKI